MDETAKDQFQLIVFVAIKMSAENCHKIENRKHLKKRLNTCVWYFFFHHLLILLPSVHLFSSIISTPICSGGYSIHRTVYKHKDYRDEKVIGLTRIDLK